MNLHKIVITLFLLLNFSITTFGQGNVPSTEFIQELMERINSKDSNMSKAETKEYATKTLIENGVEAGKARSLANKILSDGDLSDADVQELLAALSSGSGVSQGNSQSLIANILAEHGGVSREEADKIANDMYNPEKSEEATDDEISGEASVDAYQHYTFGTLSSEGNTYTRAKKGEVFSREDDDAFILHILTDNEEYGFQIQMNMEGKSGVVGTHKIFQKGEGSKQVIVSTGSKSRTATITEGALVITSFNKTTGRIIGRASGSAINPMAELMGGNGATSVDVSFNIKLARVTYNGKTNTIVK